MGENKKVSLWRLSESLDPDCEAKLAELAIDYETNMNEMLRIAIHMSYLQHLQDKCKKAPLDLASLLGEPLDDDEIPF